MKHLLTIILLSVGLQVSAQVTPLLPAGATSYSSQIYRKISGADTTYYTGATGKGFLKLGGYADVLRLQDSISNKANKTFNNVASGAIAQAKVNGLVDSLTAKAGKNLLNVSKATVTGKVDSTVFRTLSNSYTKAQIQTFLGLKLDASEKGATNGVASLVGGKVPLSQIDDALIGAVNYQGTYNATTNVPTLATPSTSNKGHYYIVSTAGTQGAITYSVGDWAISNGVAWAKVDNNNSVTSVFGRQGAVVAVSTDYATWYQTLANLQTDLTASATKYPSVNAVNTGLGLKANLASPTFTGTVTIPSPFTLGATSVTTTGTKLNYLTSAIGTTGTASSNLVFSASPTLTGIPVINNTLDFTWNLGSLAEGKIRLRGGTDNNISGGVGISAIDFNGNNADGLGVYGADGIGFFTGPTERMRISSAGALNLVSATATTVPYFDASKNLVSSAVTPTQLGYLSGTTGTTGTGNLVLSASPTFTGTPTLPTGTIGVTQTAGNSTTALATTAFVTTADNLKANIASPTFTGTVTAPALTIPTGAVAGRVLTSDGSGNATWQTVASAYKGTWDASTNTPTIADGTGTLGDYYVVSTGGTSLGRTYVTGGQAIYNGSIWQAVGTASGVTSFASRTGAVSPISGDYSSFYPLLNGTGATGSWNINASTVTTNANLTGAVTSSGNATSLGSFTSSNLSTALTDETGSGSAVFATSPTLVTPNLGTPSTLVGTNITGTASGLTAGNVTTNANLTGVVTSTGNATAIADAALSIAKTSGLQTALDLKAPLISPSFTTPSLGVAGATSIDASTSFKLTGTGANTAGGAPYLQYFSNSANRGWLTQMNTSNNLDVWNYDGTAWGVKQTFNNDGGIGLTGPLTGATTGSFSGKVDLTASSAELIIARTTGSGFVGNATGGAYVNFYGATHATKANKTEISGAAGVDVLNAMTGTSAVFSSTITGSNLSGTNTGDNATNTTSNTYADAKVQNSLTASTTIAPSATSVNTALALKEDVSNKSTSTSLGTSNTLYPTQNAVKTYVDNAFTGYADGGTYTPTATGTLNTSGITMHKAFYTVVNNIVHVEGSFSITTVGGSATATSLRFTLPPSYVSSLSTAYDLAGHGGNSTNNTVGSMNADSTNDQAIFYFNSNTTSDQEFKYSFKYEAIQ